MSVAIVTGASRGLGKEVSRQLARKGYVVLMTGRTKESIVEAARELRSESGVERVEPFVVDVTVADHINELYKYVLTHFTNQVDILINNAGVYPDHWTKDTHPYRLDPSLIIEAVDVNAIGAFRMCQRFVPLMVSRGRGRIVNVSSGMGQLHEMNKGSAAYRISKTAMNAVTKIFAAETAGSDVLVNSVCPGWVRTDMGGSNAPLSVEEGADSIVWAATLPEGSPSGVFFQHKHVIPW